MKLQILNMCTSLGSSTLSVTYHRVFYLIYIGPASVAQLDARPTGDQEVAGSTPAESAILSLRFDHEIFSTIIVSLPPIQEGQWSVSGDRMCTILVNRLED